MGFEKRQMLCGALALGLFAALLLAGTASSAGSNYFEGYLANKKAGFEKNMDNWWTMAITALLICISFNLLVLMLGYALESQEIKNYARAEFLQVSASSLMIFFAVALLFEVTSGGGNVSAFDFMGDIIGDGASSISCAAVPDGSNRFYIWRGAGDFGQGPIGAFKCKLQEKINALDNAYANVESANRPIEQLTSMVYYVLGVPVYSGDWDLGMHKRVEEAHLLSSKIVDLQVSLHAQFVLAEYVQKNMLSVFLPLGLVLRIFPLTRGVGGLFIAIGVGFFFVWPTFFLLSDPSFIRVNNPPGDAKQEGACFNGFRGSAVILAGVVANAAAGQQSDLAIAEGKDLVYQMTIATMFYPFVALVLTLIFIRAMTPLLGGDMGELMRMVSRLG